MNIIKKLYIKLLNRLSFEIAKSDLAFLILSSNVLKI